MNTTLLKKLAILAVFLCSSLLSTGQDQWQWWNEKVNWDGVTSWREYLILSPKYMGPNALPVPPMKNGRFKNATTFTTGISYHHNEGDKTTDLLLDFFAPLADDIAGLHLWMVPVEFYRMDTNTRDVRRSRDYDGKGFSLGDVYIGTFIQLLKDHEKLPDLLLTINLKTPSGSNLSGARYTDTPGYFFDISAGKSFPVSGSSVQIRPSIMTGFYAFQTNLDVYLQNDAVMYGAALEVLTPKIRWQTKLTGYAGYIDNGDKPMVLRLAAETRPRNKTAFRLFLEHGLNDFPYTSVRVSMVFQIPGL